MTDHAAEALRLLLGRNHSIDPNRDYADHYPPSHMELLTAQTHALLAIAERLDRMAQPATPGGTHQVSTDTDPRPICGTPHPGRPDIICDDVPHHYGVHDHLNWWWPNDSYPPSTGPCGIPADAYDCILYAGHPGPCNTTPDQRRS